MPQIEAHLKAALADGCWHPSKPLRERIMAEVGCGWKSITDALWALGGDVENHWRAGSRWRITPDAAPREYRWHYVKKAPVASGSLSKTSDRKGNTNAQSDC
jgi:hypothetical protein